MFEDIQSFFTTRPKRPTSSLGAGASAEDDPAMPVFQKAWKDGALVEDLFGPSPFTLHGSVGRSGADNFRPDVAKVETFLGDAGYYKPLTNDGPSGWHNGNLDQAIRTFQKDKGLEVDGFLKPNGPTIGKIGSLLGGTEPQQSPSGEERPTAPWVPERPPASHPMPKPPVGEPGPKPGDIWDLLQSPNGELTPQQQLEALIRIMNDGKPPQPRPQPQPQPPYVLDEDPRPKPRPERDPDIYMTPPTTFPRLPATSPGPFANHTINQDGIDANQAYAEMLVRDSDPRQTARMLKRAIDDYGDQGRGDVADLLARFHKIDGAKAEDLRRQLHKATGEMLPYRLAPLGEGFREPTEEEKIAAAPKPPFGPSHGADRWAAGNMADVLLGRGDYGDAITHFKGEIGRNRAETMPYLAAVHEIMGDKNPGLAARFATQMHKAGLTQDDTGAPAGNQDAAGGDNEPKQGTENTTAPQEGGEQVADAGSGDTSKVTNSQGKNTADWEALQKPDEVAEQEWKDFKDGLRNNGNLNDHERFTFLMTFGHEGGAKRDDNGGGADKPSAAGLTQATIKGLERFPGEFPDDVSKLTMDQRVTLYQRIANEALKTDNTGVRLDGLKDPKAAAQFFDVYFQHSAGTRPAIIQNGLNQTIAELPEDVRAKLDLKRLQVSGDIGKQTRGTLIKLIENGYADKVRANIAKQRDAHFGGKPTGNNQVRIESTR